MTEHVSGTTDAHAETDHLLRLQRIEMQLATVADAVRLLADATSQAEDASSQSERVEPDDLATRIARMLRESRL